MPTTVRAGRPAGRPGQSDRVAAHTCFLNPPTPPDAPQLPSESLGAVGAVRSKTDSSDGEQGDSPYWGEFVPWWGFGALSAPKAHEGQKAHGYDARILTPVPAQPRPRSSLAISPQTRPILLLAGLPRNALAHRIIGLSCRQGCQPATPNGSKISEHAPAE